MSIPPAVSVQGVTRTFTGPKNTIITAVDDVSLDITKGEIVGLLGPNGAGKTTLISMITGLRSATSGQIRLFGYDPRQPSSRTSLGVAPQETGLPPTLRVSEILDFVAGHYPDPLPRNEIVDRFDLSPMLRKQAGSLSGGQRRRVLVALALIGRPAIAVLDEPTTGLDVSARRSLWDGLLASHASGTTTLLTSHYLEEIQALAQRVVIMDDGKVLADDSLTAVMGKVTSKHVALRVPPSADAAFDALIAKVSARIVAGEDLVAEASEFSPDGERDRRRLIVPDSDGFVRELVAANIPFTELEIRGASLEEAFLSLTEGARS